MSAHTIPPQPQPPNQLFYGDNLRVLRDHIADASVDLIYLDPPFNSKRDYNLLFKSPKKLGKASRSTALSSAAAATPEFSYADAQITAFEDTWHWNDVAEREFDEILKCSNTDVSELMKALRSFLKRNDMLAYLTMMCNRLLELHRVLKPTGSLYLHCDPTASHYLKLVLDGVFGKEHYTNEIVWERSAPKGHAFTRYASAHDVILFYSKSDKTTWNPSYLPHRDEYIESHYGNIEPETGRRFQLDNLLNPAKNRPNLTYEFPPNSGNVRVWRWTHDRMLEAWQSGRVIVPKSGGMPRFKRYLDEMPGTHVSTVWADIPPINSQADERMGYPTQKPVALLERIISASSNEGDVVLDPFCGCGTAVHAAEKLGRRWIGIDITHLSIGLIEKRMKDAFPKLAVKGAFTVVGTPRDFGSAQKLALEDKYQFQSWACMLVDAQIYKGGKKGADGGIDGLRWLQVERGNPEKVIVQVKGGANVSRADIATLIGDVAREKAVIGLFVTLTPPTREMVKEAAAAGLYESPLHGSFPKIQILTIEGLMAERERPKFPDMSSGQQTFKKAKKENVAPVSAQAKLI